MSDPSSAVTFQLEKENKKHVVLRRISQNTLFVSFTNMCTQLSDILWVHGNMQFFQQRELLRFLHRVPERTSAKVWFIEKVFQVTEFRKDQFRR